MNNSREFVLRTAFFMAGAALLVPTSTLANSNVTARKATTHTVEAKTLNIYTLPRVEPGAEMSSRPRSMPRFPLGRSKPSTIKAPFAQAMEGMSFAAPAVLTGFDGMADSTTICPPFGCQPPDMALATSSKYVLQGVNTSYALYSTKGDLVAGPVNAQDFFGVPDPAPFGCDPTGPFMSDPRAFYDPNSGLFWVALLQVEGSLGVAPSCHFLSAYWIANLDPVSGIMHVYRFDMALGTTNAADYTEFGFNATTVTFTGNMVNKAGTSYQAEAQFADKAAMQAGDPVTPVAFTKLNVFGLPVDDVQPVETQTSVASDPGVQYLVNSFNAYGDLYGDDCLNTACHGFVVWAYNPASKTLSGTLVESASYIVPPNADQPACTQCVETIDTRITGTPVYSIGAGVPLITFGLGTALFNGTETVAGIFWGQISPTLSGGAITSASIFQFGRLVFAGDQASSFPALMQDKNGTVFMVFDTMSSTLNPSIMVTKRGKNDPKGTFRTPTMLKQGENLTFDSRWGDFEATSYTGATTNHVWVASQYSGINGDWATFIAQQE